MLLLISFLQVMSRSHKPQILCIDCKSTELQVGEKRYSVGIAAKPRLYHRGMWYHGSLIFSEKSKLALRLPSLLGHISSRLIATIKPPGSVRLLLERILGAVQCHVIITLGYVLDDRGIAVRFPPPQNTLLLTQWLLVSFYCRV